MGPDLVNWSSKSQRSVTLSTMESELYAAVELSKDLTFLQNLLNELVFPNSPKHIHEIVQIKLNMNVEVDARSYQLLRP